MTKRTVHHARIIAISPSSRGFGFAVLEGGERLVDWGVKSVGGDKNAGCVAKVRELVALYQPTVLVLENTTSTHSRRSPRISALNEEIRSIAESSGLRVVSFSREQVAIELSNDKQTTKHELAELLAARFPEELGSRLPPKRRPWMSEDYRIDIFDAAALAWTCWVRKIEKRGQDQLARPQEPK